MAGHSQPESIILDERLSLWDHRAKLPIYAIMPQDARELLQVFACMPYCVIGRFSKENYVHKYRRNALSHRHQLYHPRHPILYRNAPTTSCSGTGLKD